MPISKAQLKATQKYQEKAYERITLRVKTGQKTIYEQQAKSKGMSLNSYIVSLLERDRAEEN